MGLRIGPSNEKLSVQRGDHALLMASPYCAIQAVAARAG